MKDVFLIYDTCCFYEIVLLNYFMSCTDCDVIFCSPDGNTIRTAEGYSVNADCSPDALNLNDIRSFILPGGDITSINTDKVWNVLKQLKEKKVLLAGICAGTDVLKDAGILRNVKSTHSEDADMINDNHVITALPNAYVDFAVEAAKSLNLFTDEADLQETIDFWKYHKRAE